MGRPHRILLMAESQEEIKTLLMKVNKKSEKASIKPNIQKAKIMASSPITSWQIDAETMETVTTAMKLKDTSSLEEKL